MLMLECRDTRCIQSDTALDSNQVNSKALKPLGLQMGQLDVLGSQDWGSNVAGVLGPMNTDFEDPALQGMWRSPGHDDQRSLTKPSSVIQMVHLNGSQRLGAKGDSFGCVAVVAFMGQHRSIMRLHLDVIKLTFGEVGNW